MKKILINAIFFALISSGPVNAEVSEQQSISQKYEKLKVEFNAKVAEIITTKNRKYDHLDIKKIVLPNNSSIKRSYECSSSGNIIARGSESPNSPMEVIANQEMSSGSNVTHSESNVLISMQMPEALGLSEKLEMSIDKKDPSLSFARYGDKTIKFLDLDLSPQLKQLFNEFMTQHYSQAAIEVGSKSESLGLDGDALVSQFAELLSEDQFEIKSTDLLEDSSETISIGEYQTSNSGKLLAYINRSMGAIEVKGSNHSVQFIKFGNGLNHVPTGAPLHQIALEYKMYRAPEGMFATKTFMETECFLDAPEQLPDTISNQLKGVSK